MQKKGLFISVEGIDGAGKSTHLEFVRQYLEERGHTVFLTREPGGTDLGEKIRDLLLQSKDMQRITELLLMFASRQELIQNVIIPKLNSGVCVVADRFIDASIAYQGGGRNIGVDKVMQVVSLLEPSLTTDLTLLFDASLDVALGRVQRSRNKDRIEQESIEFFRRVQNAYYHIAASEPDRMKIINTEQTHADTREIVALHLDDLLNKMCSQ